MSFSSVNLMSPRVAKYDPKWTVVRQHQEDEAYLEPKYPGIVRIGLPVALSMAIWGAVALFVVR